LQRERNVCAERLERVFEAYIILHIIILLLLFYILLLLLIHYYYYLHIYILEINTD